MKSNFAPQQQNEEAIVRRFVLDALAAGYSLSVWDGEAMALTKSRDADAVLDAMNSTDMDHVHLTDAADNTVGWVSFVYGNDCDVICDCTDNPATLAILLGAEALAEKLSETQ